MSEKVYKYKIISWVTGVLGAFALVTGVGALVATVTYVDYGVGEPITARLIGPAAQIVFAALVVVGSILMYRKRIVGKRLLQVVISTLLVIAVIDLSSYFYQSKDYADIISGLLLQVIPLAILLLVVVRANLGVRE